YGLTPYLNYFTLPGNELYYKFTWGDVAFYSLNSTATSLSSQKKWLEEEIKKCDKNFNIVYFHHPPYSGGNHGNKSSMQWDFHALGVDAVISGHDHLYERIEKYDEPGLHYLINGAGGRSLYSCNDNPLEPGEFSVVCFDEYYGAIKGKANAEKLILEFFSVDSPEVPLDVLIISSK
ncbi:metallophosphoesterase family protein, partial [Bacteroidota bacterium]